MANPPNPADAPQEVERTVDDTTSPISRLPPELLCYIFASAVPAQSDLSPAVPVIGRRSWDEPLVLSIPWVFGHVCSQWRVLATSLPTLWTGITVSTTLLPRELPLLHTQLARTGTAPLDVLVRFTSHGHRRARGHALPKPSPFQVFLRTLITHSARWRTLHLQFVAPRHDAALPGLHPGALPHLESLTFSGFTMAPSHPSISSGTPQLYGARSLARWAEIHLRNLAAAPALEECSISFSSYVPAADIYRGPILTLPRVRRLVVTHPAFLDRIAAPALQSLYVCGAIEHILPFLHRSGRAYALRELTLARCTAPASEIAALLQHTPGLRALALDLFSPPAALVAALAAPHESLPRPGSLSWADFGDALDRGAFADMVVAMQRCPWYGLVKRRPPTHEDRGWRLRALPGLEVVFLNSKKGSLW
ncbi:hypothetical protein B0H13DRAFT_1908313 [Mycena leptocephala]|nr:hypothetical protein B0H13DRAFT_1908313 [Mycena leptocephala]